MMLKLRFRNEKESREIPLDGEAEIIYDQAIAGPDGTVIAYFQDGFWRLQRPYADDLLWLTVVVSAASPHLRPYLPESGN